MRFQLGGVCKFYIITACRDVSIVYWRTCLKSSVWVLQPQRGPTLRQIQWCNLCKTLLSASPGAFKLTLVPYFPKRACCARVMSHAEVFFFSLWICIFCDVLAADDVWGSWVRLLLQGDVEVKLRVSCRGKQTAGWNRIPPAAEERPDPLLSPYCAHMCSRQS